MLCLNCSELFAFPKTAFVFVSHGHEGAWSNSESCKLPLLYHIVANSFPKAWHGVAWVEGIESRRRVRSSTLLCPSASCVSRVFFQGPGRQCGSSGRIWESRNALRARSELPVRKAARFVQWVGVVIRCKYLRHAPNPFVTDSMCLPLAAVKGRR